MDEWGVFGAVGGGNDGLKGRLGVQGVGGLVETAGLRWCGSVDGVTEGVWCRSAD